MTWRRTILTLCLSLAVASIAAAGGPPEWELLQNDPNPFCPRNETTGMTFMAPVPAYITLVVFAPGSDTVVRTLVDGIREAAFWVLFWDGRDDAHEFVPDGSYPYRLTATEPGTGAFFFVGELIATVDCSLPVEKGSWGRVKARFDSE